MTSQETNNSHLFTKHDELAHILQDRVQVNSKERLDLEVWQSFIYIQFNGEIEEEIFNRN